MNDDIKEFENTIAAIEGEKYQTPQQEIDLNNAKQQLEVYQTRVKNAEEWLGFDNPPTTYKFWNAQQEIGGRAEDKQIKLQKELQEGLSKLGVTLEAGAINYKLNLAFYNKGLEMINAGESIEAILQKLQLVLDSQGIK
jgi:hypothetical protein